LISDTDGWIMVMLSKNGCRIAPAGRWDQIDRTKAFSMSDADGWMMMMMRKNGCRMAPAGRLHQEPRQVYPQVAQGH
jgi:hypothetical protein